MPKAMRVWMVALTLTLLFGLTPLQAQETNKQAPDDKTKAEQSEKRMYAYRLDFSVIEMEDSKKINTRHYVLNLNSGNWNHTKIGTRVPISTPQTPLQYMDVGTSIECRLAERDDALDLDVRSDFSNFSSPNELHSTQPIVRQISINGSTLATLGKSAVIGSVDDPNSNRQFQLEVTVTKLR